jgi:hypothetical protein
MATKAAEKDICAEDQKPLISETEKKRLVEKYSGHTKNNLVPGGQYTAEETMAILKKIEDIELQVYQKAEELEKGGTSDPHSIHSKITGRVIPIILVHEGELVIGYLKEPQRIAKLEIMDAQMLGRGLMQCSNLVPSLLIEGVSDHRLSSWDPQYDSLYMSVALIIYNEVQFQINMSKKNLTK